MTENIVIWGREFDIIIDFDLYPNETVSDEQTARLKSFISNKELLSDNKNISEYCLKNNRNEIGSSIDNIFKYVIPTAILIPKENDRKQIFLFLDYKFDIEHGLAIVYENNQFISIVPQDDVL